MTLETYWLFVPLVGICLSGFGWLALWLTGPQSSRLGGRRGSGGR